jgi:hypothetical protein
MIQLAWRFLMFQKDSALAQWFRARTENARASRKTMIVALARKLLIALWRLVREGVVPDGVSPIWPATLIVSPSPTAACSHSTITMSDSPGRIIARTASAR